MCLTEAVRGMIPSRSTLTGMVRRTISFFFLTVLAALCDYSHACLSICRLYRLLWIHVEIESHWGTTVTVCWGWMFLHGHLCTLEVIIRIIVIADDFCY
jgi:apolipoprotein N-acyltransferase